jgi:hypothetical protein
LRNSAAAAAAVGCAGWLTPVVVVLPYLSSSSDPDTSGTLSAAKPDPAVGAAAAAPRTAAYSGVGAPRALRKVPGAAPAAAAATGAGAALTGAALTGAALSGAGLPPSAAALRSRRSRRRASFSSFVSPSRLVLLPLRLPSRSRSPAAAAVAATGVTRIPSSRYRAASDCCWGCWGCCCECCWCACSAC